MNTHRYILEPYNGKNRYTCPNCDTRKTFTRYIDTETNIHLANHVGKCDRAENCGYHYTPKQYFNANPHHLPPKIKPEPLPKPVHNTLPFNYIELSQREGRYNHFVYFLGEMFGEYEAWQLALKYHIGTSKHWLSATVFWQVDVSNIVRTGKIMQYDKETCKRIKKPYNHVAWVHDVLRKQGAIGTDFELKQCLFGEHLLKHYPNMPVAICESEKTAVIASVYRPEFVWLASGSLQGLSVEKCRVLKDRHVTLFPDMNGYPTWREKAKELNLRYPNAYFYVDPELRERVTPYDIERGTDIADIWIDSKLYEWEIEREMGLR